MFERLQKLKNLGKNSAFLWGPRQTGKSTLLKKLFPKSLYYDLLLSDEFVRLSNRPFLLRQEILANHKKLPVVIDEVQNIPALLNEVHWLMVNHNINFIMCGSSARKLKRYGANLLGGRALRYELLPLVYKEISNFNLIKALNNGLLPRHYIAKNVFPLLQAYVGDYLKEEISHEAISRTIPVFGRFLESSAFSNGEVINYTNIASDCGISAVTVKNYFQILFDTLIAKTVPSFRKKPKRRVILADKFYFFDIGVVNYLLKRKNIAPGTELFGRTFEHFVFQEITAHSSYSGLNYPICYWRTASQLEVDFILADGHTALEVKGVEEVLPRHLSGLKAFCQEYTPKNAIVVSLDKRPRRIGKINILPWKTFLNRLWNNEVIKL